MYKNRQLFCPDVCNGVEKFNDVFIVFVQKILVDFYNMQKFVEYMRFLYFPSPNKIVQLHAHH